MSESLSVQIIATTGLVVVALLGLAAPFVAVGAARLSRRVKAIGVQAEEIRGQVQNDHSSNLREDIDEKHDDNQKILLTIQRDVAWLLRRQIATDDRLDTLEDTEGRKYSEHPHTPTDPAGSGSTRRERRERAAAGRVAYSPVRDG